MFVCLGQGLNFHSQLYGYFTVFWWCLFHWLFLQWGLPTPESRIPPPFEPPQGGFPLFYCLVTLGPKWWQSSEEWETQRFLLFWARGENCKHQPTLKPWKGLFTGLTQEGNPFPTSGSRSITPTPIPSQVPPPELWAVDATPPQGILNWDFVCVCGLFLFFSFIPFPSPLPSPLPALSLSSPFPFPSWLFFCCAPWRNSELWIFAPGFRAVAVL